MATKFPDLVLSGRPVEVRYSSQLRDTAGNEAHAASFLRRRVIVLDVRLLRSKREHQRILLHEIFHFAWLRLSVRRRADWQRLLRRERGLRARGEAGWSAEWRKCRLTAETGTAWRDYCCESFCDTAAWLYGGDTGEVTLAPRHLAGRREWFERLPSPFPI